MIEGGHAYEEEIGFRRSRPRSSTPDEGSRLPLRGKVEGPSVTAGRRGVRR